ncbi:hypothetical protein [Blastococcus sp. SYSU D00695]
MTVPETVELAMTSTADTRVQLTTTPTGGTVVPAPRGPTDEPGPVPGSEEERQAAAGPRHPAHGAIRPVAHDAARPDPHPEHGSRAGWIALASATAAAAWVAGWVAGVSWAWRTMTPHLLRRTHPRPGAPLAGTGAARRS